MNIHLKHGTLSLGKGEDGFFYTSFVSHKRNLFHQHSHKGLAHALWLLEVDLKSHFQDESEPVLEHMYDTQAFMEVEKILCACSIRIVEVADGRIRAACLQTLTPRLAGRTFSPGVYVRKGIGDTIAEAVMCAWTSLDYEKVFIET